MDATQETAGMFSDTYMPDCTKLRQYFGFSSWRINMTLPTKDTSSTFVFKNCVSQYS
jgi:hypothetical protein